MSAHLRHADPAVPFALVHPGQHGCPYGTHRVIQPQGVLPQPAWRIDNTMSIYDNEILIDVDALNVDAASFTQIKQAAKGDVDRIAATILDIVAQRGKLHNPVTGSGGMLIGRVAALGPALDGKTDLAVGDKVATMVSLSLTPLRIDQIHRIHQDKDQVDITGQAILFESGLYARLPDDIPEKVALAILDVAGAPAQTARLVKPGDTVVVVGGGGKSGTLCVYEAKKRAGPTGCVIGVSPFEKDCQRLRELGWADHALQVDATNAVAMMQAVAEVTQGRLADVVINCVNLPHTEMGSVLATKDRGRIYFFSMATSFTAASLGAEGVGKDVDMLMGNGYARGNADYALSLLRESPALRHLFDTLYV